MRRILILTAALAVLSLCLPPGAHADGLYKGHGLRSKDLNAANPQAGYPTKPPFPWAVRLNFEGGFHGAYQARDINVFDPSPYETFGMWDWKFGGYAQLGFEMHLGGGASLEGFAMYGGSDNPNYLKDFNTPIGTGILRSEKTEVYGVGGTLRKHWPFPSGTVYLGGGGGYMYSRAKWYDPGQADTLDFTDQAPEAHFVLGSDFFLNSVLSLGFEFGWRWTWLGQPNQFDGAMLALRMGIQVPR